MSNPRAEHEAARITPIRPWPWTSVHTVAGFVFTVVICAGMLDVARNLLPKLRRFRHSIESRGVPRTLMDVASHLTTYHPDRDQDFDRRHGTDTAGSVSPAALGIASDERREQAILYLPSPVSVTRWMLENVGIAHREFSFVDLGCGKGRVLLVAAQCPFQRVLGVDISAELAGIARKNAGLFRAPPTGCADIRVVNGDATTVDFPETDLLVHLYHPFDVAVTRGVLARLQGSLQAKPRRVKVAYLLYTGAVPEVRAVFSEFPWLREVRYEHSLFGHYDWLFFSN